VYNKLAVGSDACGTWVACSNVSCCGGTNQHLQEQVSPYGSVPGCMEMALVVSCESEPTPMALSVCLTLCPAGRQPLLMSCS